MNIHLPTILGFTRYQGFDPSPTVHNFGEFSQHLGLLEALRLQQEAAAGKIHSQTDMLTLVAQDFDGCTATQVEAPKA